MKRLLTLLLVVLVCFGCMTLIACGDNTDTDTGSTPEVPSNLDNAIEYVFSMYNSGLGDEAAKLEKDLTVIASVIVEKDTFNVEWSVEVTKGAADAVKVVDGANNTKTIDIPDYNDEQIEFTLKATVKGAGDETGNVSFKYYIPVRVKQEIDSSSKIVLKFMDGETTKYITGKHYLYTSSSSGSQKWELELTENLAEALAITVVENDDNTVSFVAEGKYLFCDATNVKFVDTQDDNTKFVLEPTSNGTFIKCAVANYNGKAQYLEVYSGYLTCYGMNADKADIYTFVFGEADSTVAGTIVIPDNTDKPGSGDNTPGGDDKPTTGTPVLEAETPAVNTAYKLAFVQGNLNKAFYLTGAMSSFYMASTENFAEAVDFYVEATDGGYYLYCMVDDAKKYVNIAAAMGTDGKEHINATYDDSAVSVYTYDETLKTLVTKVNDTDYILGTRNDKEYSTLGPMKTDSGCFNAVLVTKAATVVEGGDDNTGDDDTTGGDKVNGVTYDFSTFEKGEQYVYDERKLDDIITMMLTECHLNGELRIYNTLSEQYGNHDGYAIFASTKVITAIALNAGNKDDNLLVYGSVDGENYELVATFAVVAGYNDNSIEIDASKGYKYIKLDAESKQIRVKTLTLAFADGTTGDDNTGDDNTGDDNTDDNIADTIFIQFADDAGTIKYVTGKEYLYTSASSGNQKIELELTENIAEALAFTVQKNPDNIISFVANGKYLFCDGNNVKLADTEDDYTKFVLEATTNGFFIKCAVANFNGKAQYLEVYSGYLTCYGMNESNASIYTFALIEANTTGGDDNTGDDNTGDDNTGDDNTGDVIPEKIVIEFVDGDTTKYITGKHYLYTSSSGSEKWELELTENLADALAITVQKNDDNTISFVAEGKYLFCNGTDVKFVDTQDDNTKFVIEDATNGKFIKCAVANFNGKAQYLEVYSGYLTCYGMNESKANIYTFSLVEADESAVGTIVIPEPHVCTVFNDATCTTPKTCTECGATVGSALGHSYADGVCSVCGANEPTVDGTSVTASKTVADLITEYGWTTSTTKQSFNLDDNVSVKVDGGSNSGKAYNGDHIRIYATDTPAGTLTISVADGYELVSVKVTTLTGTYAFLCVDGSTADISNQSVVVSGTSVLLNTVKNGDNGKQVRVTAIEVVYKEA